MKEPKATDSKTVLIIDDDQDMTDLLTTVLNQGGVKVVSVCDGRAALELLERGPTPDLILTDVCMPGMDGPEFMLHLKDNPKTQRVPVIVASGIEGLGSVAQKMGAQNHLLKPFRLSSFQAMVQRYI